MGVHIPLSIWANSLIEVIHLIHHVANPCIYLGPPMVYTQWLAPTSLCPFRQTSFQVTDILGLGGSHCSFSNNLSVSATWDKSPQPFQLLSSLGDQAGAFSKYQLNLLISAGWSRLATQRAGHPVHSALNKSAANRTSFSPPQFLLLEEERGRRLGNSGLPTCSYCTQAPSLWLQLLLEGNRHVTWARLH